MSVRKNINHGDRDTAIGYMKCHNSIAYGRLQNANTAFQQNGKDDFYRSVEAVHLT